jgi:hypothetical protein
MRTLDHPTLWRTLLNGVYAQAEHHGREALPILDSVWAALWRFADMRTWPEVTKGKTRALGVQIRFDHGPHRLKLRWDHAERVIVLAEVLGPSEGPVLARFRKTDSALVIHATMRTALRALIRAAA